MARTAGTTHPAPRIVRLAPAPVVGAQDVLPSRVPVLVGRDGALWWLLAHVLPVCTGLHGLVVFREGRGGASGDRGGRPSSTACPGHSAMEVGKASPRGSRPVLSGKRGRKSHLPVRATASHRAVLLRDPDESRCCCWWCDPPPPPLSGFSSR